MSCLPDLQKHSNIKCFFGPLFLGRDKSINNLTSYVKQMKTKDLNLAAYLIAKGQALLCAHPNEYGKYYFEFMDDENVERLTEEYYLGQALVNPYPFVIAQKTLKNIVRNYKPNVNYVKGTILSRPVSR